MFYFPLYPKPRGQVNAIGLLHDGRSSGGGDTHGEDLRFMGCPTFGFLGSQGVSVSREGLGLRVQDLGLEGLDREDLVNRGRAMLGITSVIFWLIRLIGIPTKSP